MRYEKPVPVFTTLKDYKFFDFPVESVIYVGDSTQVQVEIPIEHKVYRDSTYEVEISGFRPNLEHVEIYPRTTTITNTELVYRKPMVSVGLGASVIYNPVNKNWDWGISLGIYVPL